MKRNKNFLSYRLQKRGTPRVLQTDRRSGPNTRPAFAKAMQVKQYFFFVALRPMSTAMVIAGRSVHLTTLFPGQA